MADLNGKIVKQLTHSKGYDAEATLSPDGKKMIYTSDKDGDIDLYIMDLETGKEKRITNTLGYDGGAWFSPDGKKIIWRASRPKTDEEVKEYKDLLAENLVAPTNMEVFVANADGSNVKQVTHFGQANWAPGPEFGITGALPQYSGGLGILAGDHLKSASDTRRPHRRRRPVLQDRLLQAEPQPRRLAAGDLPGPRPRRAAAGAAPRRRRRALRHRRSRSPAGGTCGPTCGRPRSAASRCCCSTPTSRPTTTPRGSSPTASTAAAASTGCSRRCCSASAASGRCDSGRG